jgi:hypothetical protein
MIRKLLLVKFFPNPTTNNVTILSGEPAVLQITDMQGKQLLTKELHPNESISLEQQPAGIYFFQVSSEKGSVMQRIVKY